MRADKDDAPWSVRQQRSDSAALQLFCLLAGCTAIGGLLLFNSERLTTSPSPLPVMTAPAPDRAATTQPAAPRQQLAPAVISPAERPRQTDFNDHNYQPRTDINTIPAPRPRPQSSSTAHTPQPLVQRSALWSWGPAAPTDRAPSSGMNGVAVSNGGACAAITAMAHWNTGVATRPRRSCLPACAAAMHAARPVRPSTATTQCPAEILQA